MRKKYLIPVLVLAALFMAANYLLTMRTPDAKAVKEFADAGIKLTPHYLNINGRCLHYVSVGADTMPTIVFIHGSPGSWDAFETYLLNPALGARFRLISIDRPGFGYSNYGRGLNLKDECSIIVTGPSGPAGTTSYTGLTHSRVYVNSGTPSPWTNITTNGDDILIISSSYTASGYIDGV